MQYTRAQLNRKFSKSKNNDRKWIEYAQKSRSISHRVTGFERYLSISRIAHMEGLTVLSAKNKIFKYLPEAKNDAKSVWEALRKQNGDYAVKRAKEIMVEHRKKIEAEREEKRKIKVAEYEKWLNT